MNDTAKHLTALKRCTATLGTYELIYDVIFADIVNTISAKIT